MANFKEKTLKTFSKLKAEKFNETFPAKLPIYDNKGALIAFLSPITNKSLRDSRGIKLLTRWRNKNVFAFPSQFKANQSGTKKWMKNQVLNNSTRILFFIEDLEGDRIGHIGLYSFDFSRNTCEIDNVVRGKDKVKGVMTMAVKALLNWSKDQIGPRKIYLRVFSDNAHAINFYKKIGFRIVERIPMEKTTSPGMILWSENKKLKKPAKYFLKMVEVR